MSSRNRSTAGRVSVKVDPIDAELVAVWYALPEGFRKSVRRLVRQVARWQGQSKTAPRLESRKSSAWVRVAGLLSMLEVLGGIP